VLLKLTIAMLIMFAVALAGEWTLAAALDNALSQNPTVNEQSAPTIPPPRKSASG
jgi:hypothetical protein